MDFLLLEGACLTKLNRVVSRSLEIQSLLRKNKVFRLVTRPRKSSRSEVLLYVNLVDRCNVYFGTPFLVTLH